MSRRNSLGGIDRAAADFHELGERAAKRGIRVGFEALAWGRHISDYRDAWEVVRRADHPAIGLTLDSFHILLAQDRPQGDPLDPRRQDIAGPACRRAVARHGRDVLEPAFPLLSRARANFRCSISWMRCRRPATAAILSLEIFNDQFRAGSPRGVAVDGQRSLVYLMDQMRGRPARWPKPRRKCRRARNASASSSSNSPPTTAPRPSSRKLFAGLGFRKVGEHKSKAVTRLVARRDQSRPQQRQGRLRALPSAFARPVGLRDLPEGRRRGRDARPRREAARHAVPPGGRPGRVGNSGGARAGRQPALFRRSEKRARPALGHRLRPAPREPRGQRRRRPDGRSITCRSRCTTRKCCRGCCSTTRCST